jgi:type IV secretory pathway VirB10-like protein
MNMNSMIALALVTTLGITACGKNDSNKRNQGAPPVNKEEVKVVDTQAEGETVTAVVTENGAELVEMPKEPGSTPEESQPNNVQEDKTEEDKTEEDKTEEDKTEEDKTEEDKTEEDKTEEDKTEEDKTEEGKTEEGKTEEGKTEEGKTEEGKTEEGKTEEGKTEEGKTEEAITFCIQDVITYCVKDGKAGYSEVSFGRKGPQCEFPSAPAQAVDIELCRPDLSVN